MFVLLGLAVVWLVCVALLLGPMRSALEMPPEVEEKMVRENAHFSALGCVPDALKRIAQGLMLLLAPVVVGDLLIVELRLGYAHWRLRRARRKLARCIWRHRRLERD